jgi:hypothetical protein
VFDADGSPRTDEFRTNENAGNTQNQPSVTGLEGGGFVAVWYDAHSWNDRNGDYTYRDVVA